MERIEIKITFPKKEYKDWSEFYEGGIEAVKTSIINDLSERIKMDGVKLFSIEAHYREGF